MRFSETKLAGAFIIHIEPNVDERGFFARNWCRQEFVAHGLNAEISQCNIGVSKHKGTLRGLHFQLPPHSEAKLVRCSRGALYDVVVDIRPHSPTHRQWIAVELTPENLTMVYAPEGCAQGYQTLTDDTEICYQTSAFYAPQAARGVRYNDPAFAIEWPLEVTMLSEADRSWPAYTWQATQDPIGES